MARGQEFAARVGASIRYYRHRAGLSADDLARVLGVSRSTWYAREATGDGLTLEELARAASACGVRSWTVLRRAAFGSPVLTRGGY